MDRGAREELASACGLAGAGVAYLTVTAGRVGTVFYLPELGRWSGVVPPGVIGMDWFYRAAVTLVVMALAAGAGWWVGARWRGARSGARFLFGLGLAALAWGLAFTVLTLVSTPR